MASMGFHVFQTTRVSRPQQWAFTFSRPLESAGPNRTSRTCQSNLILLTLLKTLQMEMRPLLTKRRSANLLAVNIFCNCNTMMRLQFTCKFTAHLFGNFINGF
uniref:Uncharacterized protein n=1 Tax=Opuntia streptacantha TaxID=393608 RepID=A0A7C9DRS4_OPUST